MASRREINIALRTALDAAGLHASLAQFRAMSKSIRESMKEASDSSRKHMADIKAGFDMLVGGMRTAARAISTVLKSAFNFETQTTQFKTLIGNIDEAKAHMADLKALGDTPPFSLDEFAKASRQLMVMTDGALGFKESLKLVGDVAAATGQPIETVGHAVGRLYAFIRDGQPLSRAVMELRNMGVITPEVASRLDEMQKAGAKNVEIWEEVEKQLARYNGAMAETEKTGNGLMGAIKSRWDSVVRSFGQALEGEAKGGLEKLLKAMKGLEEDGSLAVWAEKCKAAAQTVANAFKSLAPVITGVWNTLVATFDAVGSEIGRFAGAISMGEFKDAFLGIGTETARAFTEAFDLDGTQAQKEADIRAKAAAEAAKKAAEAEIAETRRAEEEKARIRAQLEEAQAKQDEKAAAEAAKKAAEEAAKAEKEWQKQIEAERKRIHDEMLRQEKAFIAKRIDAIREANAKELAEIDKKIAAEREKERKWEEEAKGMREAAAGGGKGLGDFFRNRRDQRDERREARNRAVALARVNREIADLERRGGPDGRRLSDAQRERLKELRDFVNRQDPKNNPAAKAAAELEKLKLDAIKKTNTEIDTLRKTIEARTVL